jgi:thiol-disulfide isomerase/thioredoxin
VQDLIKEIPVNPQRGSQMTDIKAIHVVHATWCPHCHPTTVEPTEKVAKDLGIPFFSYDIDIPDQAAKADELVRKFGDWSEDYLVPQVFVETKEGRIRHVFTGYSESVDSTKHALNNLLNSPLFAKVNPRANK